ncbi:fatty acyl-CoA reductase 3-like [Dorcoceras hygrometricum]|uniref:Fatty acyl-CoA reductase 3-like n=1 Tax=Dorcoceras hygrometricum TaxID=472368 RepID=A0A2Z7B3J2_9LAMI|nr:fatty acyl-CoA reductase 3-like [Dorcoceras hygrometricum]
MPELDWSKISSWNSKGTPKLIRQFTSRSAVNIKMVHQLDVGAARRSSVEYEEQFKHRIKSSTEVSSKEDQLKEKIRRVAQERLQTRGDEDIFERLEEATSSNKTSSMKIRLMNKLESWLRTNQLDGRTDAIEPRSKEI